MAAEKKALAPGLYASPFSKAYWRDAVRELGKVRMLAVAAILIAVRVALKSVAIPIAPPTLMINLGFFVNALGAMIFGPVVAIIAAAISDTLGCILFPTGVYFFPFIFTEIAGSLIFALFLYRAPLTNLRVTLSRFCVSFFVNIVIQTPIMLLYYQMVLGKSYAIFDLPRICKNLVLFPIESLLLILFLNVITPLTYRMKLTYEPPKKLKITGRLVAFLLALLIVGSCATAGYAWYDYNTRNHATSLESDRARRAEPQAGRLSRRGRQHACPCERGHEDGLPRRRDRHVHDLHHHGRGRRSRRAVDAQKLRRQGREVRGHPHRRREGHGRPQ